MTGKQAGALIVAILILIVGGVTCTNMATTVGADEIVIQQDPVDGELHVWKDPGMYYQNFGRVTRYKKSSQFWFSKFEDQGKERDQSLGVRFNDGGHATISGSLRFDLPLDNELLIKLHTKYHGHEAIEQQLVRTVVEKSVYMSGPLMSSKESYAERRSDLISFIEDQIIHGVYRSETETVKEQDLLTGKDKAVQRVKLVKDAKTGAYARQEASPIEEYGIRVNNLSINEVKYDPEVESQIQSQQQAIMQVQTAIAEAQKSQQKAITVEAEGKAEAAKSKWEQEALKAKAVTEAEQQRDVARLKAEAADFTKKEQTLLGEGEAARKKAVMVADGALEKKLSAWVDVNRMYAAELGKQRWVPEVQMGGNAGGGGGNAVGLVELLMAKTARDLALDMSVPRGNAQRR